MIWEKNGRERNSWAFYNEEGLTSLQRVWFLAVVRISEVKGQQSRCSEKVSGIKGRISLQRAWDFAVARNLLEFSFRQVKFRCSEFKTLLQRESFWKMEFKLATVSLVLVATKKFLKIESRSRCSEIGFSLQRESFCFSPFAAIVLTAGRLGSRCSEKLSVSQLFFALISLQ